MSKKKPIEPAELAAHQRLYQKVAALGDDAPIELDEVAAYWSVSPSSAEKIVAELPVANPLERVRRWRYGEVRKHFVEMAKDKAS